MISKKWLVELFMMKHFYYNSALMRVIDDDITHITAAEVRH